MDPPPPIQPADQYRNWLELPQDVTLSILRRLDPIEILTSAQKVCLLWRNICKEPYMWRAVDMRFVEDPWNLPYDLGEMCRHVVDLSCGQLVEINVGSFCTDDLLKYITESSSQLRHLGLLRCDEISEDGLREAAAKIPLLEELEILYCSWTEKCLEDLGRSCPLLKSLKLKREINRGPYKECDEWALAIAEHMPELVHLQLFGNKLTNDGLQAILDRCTRLESLELRYCCHVTMTGDFGRRCAERIKDLCYFGDDEFANLLPPIEYSDDENDYGNFGFEYLDPDY